MPSATDQLTKVEDQILDGLTTIQKPVIDAVKNVAEKIESRLPEVPGTGTLTDFDELMVSQFAFAERLLANQKAFVSALLDAVKPVSAKTTTTKAKPKTTKPAAAA